MPSEINFKYDISSFKGCIIGGSMGDAVGSYYENKKNVLLYSLTDIPWNITDDTQLTLATCEHICNSTKINPEGLANTFLKWYNNGFLSGLGASTLKALQGLQVGGHWALVGRNGDFAAGNGAAMRIAPLAFFLNPEIHEDRIIIRDICRITHHNEEAYAGALSVPSQSLASRE